MPSFWREKLASHVFPCMNYFSEHYDKKPLKKTLFSKLFSDFHFWTFLKMSIFHFPFYFSERNNKK